MYRCANCLPTANPTPQSGPGSTRATVDGAGDGRYQSSLVMVLLPTLTVPSLFLTSSGVLPVMLLSSKTLSVEVL